MAPYQVAFEESPGAMKHSAHVLEKILILVYTLDIGINFNLAFYKDEKILFERGQIAREYFRGMFWVDLVGVFPFEMVAVCISW